MNFQKLAREICKREGKKQQVNIAQVNEVLRCLCDILVERFLIARGTEMIRRPAVKWKVGKK